MNTTSNTNNKSPDKRVWGDSKNKVPDLWHTEQKLPENWGKQRNTAPASWALTADSPDSWNLSANPPVSWNIKADSPAEWNNGAKLSINYDASSTKNIIQNASEKVSSVLNNAKDTVTDSSEKSCNTFENKNFQSETAANQTSFPNEQPPPLQNNLKQSSNDYFTKPKAAAEYNSKAFEGENDVIYYSPSESNKKVIIIAIIGLISFFIVVPEIAGNLSTKKGENKPPIASDNNKIAEISEQETTAQTSVTAQQYTTAAAATEAVTQAVTAVIEQNFSYPPPNTSAHLSAVPADDIYKYPLYVDFLSTYDSSYTDSYFLSDLNGDGIPELFLKSRGSDGFTNLYTIYNGELLMLGWCGAHSWYPALESNKYIVEYASGSGVDYAGGRYTWYEYRGGEELTPVMDISSISKYDSYTQSLSSPDISCTFNSVTYKISQETFDEILNVYGSTDCISYSADISAVKPRITPSIPETSVQKGIVTTESGGLNIRSGPGTDYDKISEIPRNSSIDIYDTVNGWYYVRYGGIQGYVSTEFVTLSQSSGSYSNNNNNSSYSANGDAIAVGYISTQEGSLNMRVSASESANIITQIPQNANIDILYDQNKWYYVRYGNSCGYVKSDYVTITQRFSQRQKLNIYSTLRYGNINAHGGVIASFDSSYVVGGGTNLRIEESIADRRYIKAVNVVTVGEIVWYEIYDGIDGRYYGWVDSQFIDFI